MKLRTAICGLLGMYAASSVSAQEMEERLDRPHAIPANVLAISPIQFTENGVAGFGISYERVLDKNNNIVSFYVPAMAVLNTGSNTDMYGNRHTDPMFYVMPGIKIYPTGGYGTVKYAIGPNLVIGSGTKTDNGYDPFGYGTYTSTYNHFLFGMMVTQSVNINPTPHLYIGTDFGLGFTYINRENSVTTDTKALVEFSFKVGYRF